MILAVYYNLDSGPYTMYSLEVPSLEHHEIMKAIDQAGYPMPTADILLIENGKVIDQFSFA
jgi:hypothetical protein